MFFYYSTFFSSFKEKQDFDYDFKIYGFFIKII